MPDIRYDQGDTGIVNRSRSDITLGVSLDIVALNVVGVPVFGLLDRAPGSAASITGTGSTRQIVGDVAGCYNVRIIDAAFAGLVSSVGNNGSGQARFTTSVAHGLTTGQEVFHTSFAVVPAYKAGGVIVVISTTEYDIVAIPFTITDAGEFYQGPGAEVTHTFSVKTPLGQDLPSWNERADEDANDVDVDPSTWVNDSQTNEGGSPKGYHPKMVGNLLLLESKILLGLQGSFDLGNVIDVTAGRPLLLRGTTALNVSPLQVQIDPGGGQLNVLQVDGLGGIQLQAIVNRDVEIGASGTGAIKLSTPAGVIIGTGTPNEKLHVLANGTSGFIGSITERGILITDDVNPRIVFEDVGETAGDRVMEMGYQGQSWRLTSLTDTGNLPDVQDILVANRDGRVAVGTATINERMHVNPSGTSGYTSGAERGILITDSVGPRVVFEDTGEGVDNKVMAIRYEGQGLSIFSLNDIGNAITADNIVVVTRTGNVGFGGVPGILAKFTVLQNSQNRISVDVNGEVELFSAPGEDVRILAGARGDVLVRAGGPEVAGDFPGILTLEGGGGGDTGPGGRVDVLGGPAKFVSSNPGGPVNSIAGIGGGLDGTGGVGTVAGGLGGGTDGDGGLQIVRGGLGVGAGSDGELRLSTLGAITRVLGDLVVEGTRFIADTETVLVADNYIDLNSGYTTPAAQTGGIVTNNAPIATTDTVAGAYIAGIAAVSNPTVVTTGSATFAVGQIIHIPTGDNAGNYEVLSHVGPLLTVRGVGTAGTVEAFTQNQFESGPSDGAVITRTTLSVLRAGLDGLWEQAVSATTPFTFVDVGAVATVTAGPSSANIIGITPTTGAVIVSALNQQIDLALVNTFYGAGAGNVGVVSGGANTAFGFNALASATTAASNTAFGANALANSTATVDNTAIGTSALQSLTTGDDNTAVGERSGQTITTGSRNVTLGDNAQAPAVGTDDFINIGNSLYGERVNDRFRLGGGTVVIAGDASLRLAQTDSAFMTNVLTTPQRTGLVAENGMVAYDSGLDLFQFREAGAWVSIVTGGPFLPLAGGLLTGLLTMNNGADIKFAGGSGNNFIRGNFGNTGRLSLVTENLERLSVSLGGVVNAVSALQVAGTPVVVETRTITAGAGLTGLGDLSSNLTVDVGATDPSIVVSANSIGIGVLQSDAMHGLRGGGTQHADVIAGGASGFMDGVRATKLDALLVSEFATTGVLFNGSNPTRFDHDAGANVFQTPTGATLTIPAAAPTGTYMVGLDFEWGYDTSTSNFRSQLLQSGVAVPIMEHQEEPSDSGLTGDPGVVDGADMIMHVGRREPVSFTTGTAVTFTFQFAPEATADCAVRRISLTVERKS